MHFSMPYIKNNSIFRCIFNVHYTTTLYYIIFTVQVNLFQKHLFLYQLTHNMTKNWTLNYESSTWKFQAQNMLRTCCVHKLFFGFVLTFRTIYVHNMFSTCSELRIFMYWTYNWMNNLLSNCGLVDARISASDKYLPVQTKSAMNNQ